MLVMLVVQVPQLTNKGEASGGGMPVVPQQVNRCLQLVLPELVD